MIALEGQKARNNSGLRIVTFPQLIFSIAGPGPGANHDSTNAEAVQQVSAAQGQLAEGQTVADSQAFGWLPAADP
jgi:hypothetical protein